MSAASALPFAAVVCSSPALERNLSCMKINLSLRPQIYGFQSCEEDLFLFYQVEIFFCEKESFLFYQSWELFFQSEKKKFAKKICFCSTEFTDFSLIVLCCEKSTEEGKQPQHETAWNPKPLHRSELEKTPLDEREGARSRRSASAPRETAARNTWIPASSISTPRRQLPR
jgi:hypothetical protein